MYTEEHIVTNADWVLISSGKKNCGIQFNSTGDIRVHVGTVEPASLAEPGILLSSSTEGVPGTFGMGQLPADANVYARATGEFSTVRLTVLAY